MNSLGFTGTQRGLTSAQWDKVYAIVLKALPKEIHHGDCVGADAQFHELARPFTGQVVIHPPINNAKRAFCHRFPNPSKTPIDVLAVKPYLERNHDIVDEVEGMIACPGEAGEVLRSGTWATIRYAVKTGKKCAIIFPGGVWVWAGQR